MVQSLLCPHHFLVVQKTELPEKRAKLQMLVSLKVPLSLFLPKFNVLNVVNLLTKDQLYIELNNVNAKREKRLKCANFVINHPTLFKPLLEFTFLVDEDVSVKAAWILEFVCERQLQSLQPYLTYFTENISKVYKDSAVRPIAKICKFLVEDSCRNSTPKNIAQLNDNHKKAITEACFNWLITQQKVAAKVYAMESLLLLGLDFRWVHDELLLIIEKDYHHESAAFKAKARHIMKALRKS